MQRGAGRRNGWALWGASHPGSVPHLELDTLLAQPSPGDRAHLREERAGFDYQENGARRAGGRRVSSESGAKWVFFNPHRLVSGPPFADEAVSEGQEGGEAGMARGWWPVEGRLGLKFWLPSSHKASAGPTTVYPES